MTVLQCDNFYLIATRPLLTSLKLNDYIIYNKFRNDYDKLRIESDKFRNKFEKVKA